MATSREVGETHTDNHSRQKSLLLLVASNRRRGAEVFGERLAQGFASMGWAVDFVALRSVDSDRVVNATPLINAKGLGRLDLSVVVALRKRIAERRPSVVLANGGATLRYTLAAGTLLRHRPVLAYSSIGEPQYWLRSAQHARLQRFLHARPDVVFAVSRATRNQLIHDLHVKPGKVLVAPTGVAGEFFVESAPFHMELRLLFMGSLSLEKDPHTALEVVDHLREDFDVNLRFVGHGPLAADLKRQVSKSGLMDIVDFAGSVDDVTSHLQWSDVLVLPSATEGLPGAVLEAGAAGVPTVAFDVGGTSETMIPGRTGIVVTPGDTNAMVQAISALAGDRQHLEEMGREARDFIATQFSLQDSIRRYEEALTEALAESRTR